MAFSIEDMIAQVRDSKSNNRVINSFEQNSELAGKLKELLEKQFGNLDDIEIKYLSSGFSSIVFEVKKDEKNFVLKLGGNRKGYPKKKHKRIIDSIIYEQLDDNVVVELQKKVKTYMPYGPIPEDCINAKEAWGLVKELIESGIIVCDLKDPLNNMGRDYDTGEVVWIDKEHIYTKEELDEINPKEWDNTCDRAIYGRLQRAIGTCYGPGRGKRSREELSESGKLEEIKNSARNRNSGIEH